MLGAINSAGPAGSVQGFGAGIVRGFVRDPGGRRQRIFSVHGLLACCEWLACFGLVAQLVRAHA